MYGLWLSLRSSCVVICMRCNIIGDDGIVLSYCGTVLLIKKVLSQKRMNERRRKQRLETTSVKKCALTWLWSPVVRKNDLCTTVLLVFNLISLTGCLVPYDLLLLQEFNTTA